MRLSPQTDRKHLIFGVALREGCGVRQLAGQRVKLDFLGVPQPCPSAELREARAELNEVRNYKAAGAKMA
jgi:hypothetical protein